ncbi:hypothetical protein KKB18_11545 [bacterium]|nr:hypothetical protein [bacterium]
MEMVFSTFLAAVLTLCIYSFLYKDNPFYRIAEHLVVGVSTGYMTIILFKTTVKDNLWDPLLIQHQWKYLLPGILGMLMFTRFFQKISWISRYSIAFYMGSAGLSVPLFLRTHVIRQIHASMEPFGFDKGVEGFTWFALFNSVLIFVGVICGLTYFFFSKPHTGLVGGMAKVGIIILMVGFGSAFGYTVMSRISLLIGRLQFLIYDAFVPFYHYLVG